jgi:hypothetical protein
MGRAVMSIPAISVVMPVHDGERFLPEAVTSVLSQTHRDLELIVVDDGSTDRTAEILASYARTDPRVIIRRQVQNRGVLAARSEGLRHARGGFIAVMDADDVCLPWRLARQLEYLSKHPEIGIVGSYVQVIDEKGRPGRIKVYPQEPGLVAWSLCFFNSVANPTVLIRRTVMEALAWHSMEGEGPAQDYSFFIRASRVTKLANLPEVLLHYRVWPKNMTRQSWQAQEQNATKILQHSLSSLLQRDVAIEQAQALRGLSTGIYPRTHLEIKDTAATIERLATVFLSNRALSVTDSREIARDAGVKLCLLGALASMRSPRLAFSLGLKATRLSPNAIPHFLAKTAATVAKDLWPLRR